MYNLNRSFIFFNFEMLNRKKSTLFLITADAMNVAAAEFVQMSKGAASAWEKSLNTERTQRIRLEETVEALGMNLLDSGPYNNF